MEMWERFDTFGHQNICFTMENEGFHPKREPTSHVQNAGCDRTRGWEDLEMLGISFLCLNRFCCESRNRKPWFSPSNWLVKKPEAKPGWMIFPFIHFDWMEKLDEPTMVCLPTEIMQVWVNLFEPPHGMIFSFSNQHITKNMLPCCLWTVWVYAGLWGNLNGLTQAIFFQRLAFHHSQQIHTQVWLSFLAWSLAHFEGRNVWWVWAGSPGWMTLFWGR